MSGPRRILFFDRDPSIRDWIQGLPISHHFEVEVADPAAGPVKQVREMAPRLIFIAVDLPAKEGFALFNEIRRSVKRTPIVLATSTLPSEDMNLHAKLKMHAEAYLDKRTVSGEALLNCLNDLLALDLAPTELSALSAVVPRLETDRPPGPGDDDASRSTEAPDSSVNRDLERTATSPAEESSSRAEPVGPQGSSRLTRFKAGMAHRRRGPDPAPQPLPKSEKPGRPSLEKEARATGLGAGRIGFEALEPTVAVGPADQSLESEGVGSREDQPRQLDPEVRRLREEAERLKRGSVAATMQVEACLDQERRLHREARKRYESELALLKHRSEEDRRALEREQAARIEALEKKGNEEQARALANHQAQLQELTSEHKKEIDAARGREEELSSREAAQRFTQANREAELRVARESGRESALAEADRERRAALAEAEERRVAELAAVEERYRKELGARQEEHRVQTADIEQKERAALEQLMAATFEKQEAILALEEERRRHQESCRGLQTLVKKLEQEKAEALEAEKPRLKESLRRAEHAHEAALASLRSDHQSALQALRVEHAQALERRDAEAYQAGRREREVLEREFSAKLEEAHRERTSALEAGREEYERQVASLRAEHQSAVSAKEEALVILSGMLKSREVHWAEQLDELRKKHTGELQAQPEASQQRPTQLDKDFE